ncbi:MAG: SRPBCC domain-containing protein [Acidobacteriota bacterium]
MTIEDLTLDTTQSIDIKADIGDVYRSVMHRLGEGLTKPPEGESLQMVLEQWPGGRWFRDLGNGTGHLWGHVQTIKAPVLLELSGPMFMSYPAVNHVEVKLNQRPGGTHVELRHRAMGLIDAGHRQGVSTGWKHILGAVAQDFAHDHAAAGQRS